MFLIVSSFSISNRASVGIHHNHSSTRLRHWPLPTISNNIVDYKHYPEGAKSSLQAFQSQDLSLQLLLSVSWFPNLALKTFMPFFLLSFQHPFETVS